MTSKQLASFVVNNLAAYGDVKLFGDKGGSPIVTVLCWNNLLESK
jgi:hypothetical protein